MKPIISTERSLEFASALSPWWLLLLLPLIVVAAWRLYRNQWKDVPKPQGPLLLALRAVILVLLGLLLFRPSLVSREVRTYPGRIAVVLDDSASMSARDRYTDTEALWLARQLGQLDGPAHALAGQVGALRAEMRAFESFARDNSRGSDAFWDGAEETQATLGATLDEVAGQLPSLTAGLPEPPDLTADLQALRDGMQPFFVGDRAPAARAYAAYDAQLAALADRLYDLQARRDRLDLADAASPLHAAADQIRAQTRFELTLAAMSKGGPQLGLGDDQMYVERHTLSGREGTEQPDAMASPIVSRLQELVAAESDFPLAGVVLLTDGQTASQDANDLTARMAREQVPLMAGGIGAEQEPTDLAILDLRVAPIAAQGARLPVKIHLKSTLPQAMQATITISQDGRTVVEQALAVGATAEQDVRLEITPDSLGLQRYSVQISSVEGEIFPSRNNRQDFAVLVRQDKVRVLLLDQKPRWETRFVLNILQRLDYVDTNAIIQIVQPDGELKRGVERGTWPQDLATLEIYDLVIIGDIAPETLTEQEWQDLQTLVLEKGRHLCLLGNGVTDPLPADLQAALLPTSPRQAPQAEAADLSGLAPTAAGLLQPTTAAWHALRTPVAELETATLGLAPGAVALAVAPAGETQRPVLSLRYTGAGQVLYVDHDGLWKRLNPTALEAHAQVFVELVNGAALPRRMTGDGPDATVEPPPIVAPSVFSTGGSLSVWLPGGGESVKTGLGTDAELAITGAEKPSGSTVANLQLQILSGMSGQTRLASPSATDADSAHIVEILEDNGELGLLALNRPWLSALARDTGGEYASATQVAALLHRIPHRERVERAETVWRLWDSWLVLGLVILLLTVEWVWRKLVGLV